MERRVRANAIEQVPLLHLVRFELETPARECGNVVAGHTSGPVMRGDSNRVILFWLSGAAFAQQYIISTVAGNGTLVFLGTAGQQR